MVVNSTRNHRVRFCDNQYLNADNTTFSSEEVDFPAENCFTDRRSEVYKPTSNVVTITADLRFENELGFIGMVGKGNQPFFISATGTITLEANNLDEFTSPPLSVEIPITDLSAIKFLDEIEDTRYRFIKITIDDSLNPNPIEIGHLYLGSYLTLEKRNVANGFTKAITDPSTEQESISGALYFDERNRYFRFNDLFIGIMLRDDRLELEQFFYDVNTTQSFFMSIDPILCISNELDEFTKFVKFAAEPRIDNVKNDMFNFAYNVRENIL